MTFCCENIREAYELIGKAQNTLNWRPEGLGFSDGVAGFFTLNTSTSLKLDKYLSRAQDEMINAFKILNQARNAIDACSCGSERDFYKDRQTELVNEYNNLSSNSANKFSNLKGKFEELMKK